MVEMYKSQIAMNGGIWRVVRLSSEKSPFVSPKEIALWFQTYDEECGYCERILDTSNEISQG